MSKVIQFFKKLFSRKDKFFKKRFLKRRNNKYSDKYIKTHFKCVVKYTRRGNVYKFDFKKNKIVRDMEPPFIGYFCEGGCNMYGNFPLFLVGKAARCFDCSSKYLEENE